MDNDHSNSGRKAAAPGEEPRAEDFRPGDIPNYFEAIIALTGVKAPLRERLFVEYCLGKITLEDLYQIQ